MAAMLLNVWGAAGCERLQEYFGTQTVLFVPVEGDSGPRGLLVALLSATDGGSLMGCVLTHAATAARASLTPGSRRHEGELVAGRDYEVVAAPLQSGPEVLAGLAAAGRDVVFVLAGAPDHADAVTVLAAVRGVFPTAKRCLTLN